MTLEEKAKIVIACGLAAADTVAWFSKYQGHRDRSKKYGPRSKSTLTFADYLAKVREVNLTHPDQLGARRGKFVLVVYSERGGNTFTKENSGFVTTTVASATRNTAFVGKGHTKATHPGIAAIADKLAKRFIAVAPDGTIYQDKNVAEFSRQHGLSATALQGVFAGRFPHYKGWTGRYTTTTSRKVRINPNSGAGKVKAFILIDPQGTTHVGKNVSKFCRQHKLDPGSVSRVLSGKQPQYRGWTGRHQSNSSAG